MIAEKGSPRAWRQRGHEDKNSTTGILADRFPLCKLHNLRLVNRLPAGCALGDRNPLERIAQLQEAGWSQLAVEEYHAGGILLDAADVCNGCADRLLRNRHTLYLRKKGRRDG